MALRGGFRRPGEVEPSAFGISFDVDRDADGGFTGPPQVTSNDASGSGRIGGVDPRSLPIAKLRTSILAAVEGHATTVLVGETGCGKTTQLPQYLHAAGWTAHGFQIVCTQPRRVAAMTVAARVAEEMGCALGSTVGYAIRFEEVATRGVTAIKFATDGVLVREMMENPLLPGYSVVIVDEAHERGCTTDLLLGLLKKVQRRRPDLRVIVSSATLCAEDIAGFFDGSKQRRGGALEPGVSLTPTILSVAGRTHAVQVHYLTKPAESYVKVAVQTAVDIHREDVPGDILIFLTGRDDCEAACALLREASSHMRRGSYKYRIVACPLHAGLSARLQLEALAPAPRGVRKVVCATNVAETSVTIPGVVYVVDGMFAKLRAYSPRAGLEVLRAAPISRASAAQRAGRAGRVRPGHVFRLCTEEAHDALDEATVPEMQRSELSGVVLQLKALGVDNIMKFDWLAPPPAESMIRALELLRALGALDDGARLTPETGRRMAELPLDARLSGALLSSCEAACGEEVLTIVAMLSVSSVWAQAGSMKARDAAKARFAAAEGDLIAYLNVWKGWTDSGRSPQWAYKHRVHHRALLRAADIRTQLAHALRRFGLVTESADGDVTLIQQTLTRGLFFNAARYEGTKYDPKLANDGGTHVYALVRGVPGSKAGLAQAQLRIHPSSVLFRCKPMWVLFATAQQTDDGWYSMQDIVTTDPAWLVDAAPHMYKRQ